MTEHFPLSDSSSVDDDHDTVEGGHRAIDAMSDTVSDSDSPIESATDDRPFGALDNHGDPVLHSSSTATEPGEQQCGDSRTQRDEIREWLPPGERPDWMPKAPPGPGLPESLAWTFGVLLVHIAGSVFVVMIALVIRGVQSGSPGIRSVLDELQAGPGSWLIGGEMAVFVVAAIIGAAVRLIPGPTRRLNFEAFHPLHFVIMLLILLPMTVISGACYEAGAFVWSYCVSLAPGLEFIDQFNTVEAIQEMTQQMSLATMLLLIAVAPAIGEELVFRGIIGRGLIARWGLVPGILMTSFLFAAVHMHPAHVAGVIPLGICMHFLYVTTRSFWAPMAFHFLNNALATIAAKQMEIDPAAAADPVGSTALVTMLSASACVLLLSALLWRTRRREILPDGSEWSPGYPSVEMSPDSVPTVKAYGIASPQLIFGAFASVVLFFAVQFTEAAALVPGQ